MLATLCAGVNIYLAKVISHVNRILLTSIVLLVAGLILMALDILWGKAVEVFSYGRRYILEFLWIGIIGTSIPSSLLLYGVALSPVSNVFLIQTEVVYSMILSSILLGEKIGRKQMLSSILVFLGVLLITTEGELRGMLAGDLMLLFAPLFFQSAHIVAKRLMQKVSPLIVVTHRLLIGGLMLFASSPLLGINPMNETANMPHDEIQLIIYMGVGYAIGNALWYCGIKSVDLSKATAIMTSYPVVTVVLSMLTLGERPSPIKLVGIIITFIGVLALSLLITEGRVLTEKQSRCDSAFHHKYRM
jgi:drug/metabolite transporter (DMT)-like permease